MLISVMLIKKDPLVIVSDYTFTEFIGYLEGDIAKEK